MKRRISYFLLSLSAAAALNAGDKANDLAFVVNKGVAMDNVSKADLVKYLKAQKSKSTDGTKLVLVMQDDGRAERAAVLAKLVGMSEAEIGRYFLQATFTGAISAAPKSLPDGSAVLKFVASTPGGLGYVRASEAGESAKILKVDGKLPGEDGYPIQIQ